MLRDRPFGRAVAADLQVSLGRLRRGDLERPFHGVRATAVPVTVLDRCRAYAVRMRPADVFSHVTAALLHGIPLPRCSSGDERSTLPRCIRPPLRPRGA